MDSFSRVLFPLFSRLQSDTEKLKKIVEKIIYYESLIIIPATLGLALLMPKLVYLIPKYNQWEPALPLLYFFCISALFSSYSTPFINLLNGLGKVKTSFYFMVAWTTLTWILVPILTHFYGSFGFPITLVLLSSSFVIVINIAQRTVNFSFIKNVYQFLISSLIMTGVVIYALKMSTPSFFSLIMAILGGIISYLLILRLLFKISVFSEIKNIWKTFQP